MGCPFSLIAPLISECSKPRIANFSATIDTQNTDVLIAKNPNRQLIRRSDGHNQTSTHTFSDVLKAKNITVIDIKNKRMAIIHPLNVTNPIYSRLKSKEIPIIPPNRLDIQIQI